MAFSTAGFCESFSGQFGFNVSDAYPYKPPADAKEWTCHVCGCKHGAPAAVLDAPLQAKPSAARRSVRPIALCGIPPSQAPCLTHRYGLLDVKSFFDLQRQFRDKLCVYYQGVDGNGDPMRELDVTADCVELFDGPTGYVVLRRPLPNVNAKVERDGADFGGPFKFKHFGAVTVR